MNYESETILSKLMYRYHVQFDLCCAQRKTIAFYYYEKLEESVSEPLYLSPVSIVYKCTKKYSRFMFMSAAL